MGEQIRQYQLVPRLPPMGDWNFYPQAILWLVDMSQVEKP